MGRRRKNPDAPTQYVLSLSYGKDSLASLGAIEKLGWPLDRIVHAEVWATDTIPADLPEMIEFKAKADAIIKERYGIEVEHLCATRNGEKLTYEKLFYHIPKRRPRGKFKPTSHAGFPYTKGAWCNDRLKTNILDDLAQREREREPNPAGADSISGFQRVGGCGATSMLKRAVLRPLLRGGSWCKKLTDGTYSRLPNRPGSMVYQRSQTSPFLTAPLHKERI